MQFSSVTQSCLTFGTLSTIACQASLSITNSWSLLKLRSIKSVMPFNHLILSHTLSSPSPPAFNFTSISIFSEQYGSFSFSVSPSNEQSGLISFRVDLFDFLPVQGNLKITPTPQFKHINSSVLSFLYSATLTSIHDHWKNHSFD